ncbi:MAG TPA: tRNA lysidine(34) synthetase TilS [Acidisphaera sp.]|nr:tRNA lysidine(34) synthetase TilS [Acidisphaera sp.]
MSRLGPFPAVPVLAAGVSGGADSTALAVLADGWARRQGRRLLALIVDHGLRPASAAEAAETAARLAGWDIESRVLHLGLSRGPGQAARARSARLAALEDACAAAGITDLLLGHHAADQAETAMIRALSATGDDGFAGMPALRHTGRVRVLRPLLAWHPVRLRALLTPGSWIEDPSNADLLALRVRLRPAAAAAVEPLAEAAREAGRARRLREEAAASWLAGHATIRPEGFARIPDAPLPADALSALIRTVGGSALPPPVAAVQALAARPGPATLAGVQIVPAGRHGPGWLLVREEAAMAPPCDAVAGARWDGRFRLRGAAPPGLRIGPLGDDAARMRRLTDLPSSVLRTMPALRRQTVLEAVPHIAYGGPVTIEVLFDPPVPAACLAFVVG